MLEVLLNDYYLQAAWEAEEAYRLAREEEMKDRLLTLTGLISNDPIRRSAIHLAVERTELVIY